MKNKKAQSDSSSSGVIIQLVVVVAVIVIVILFVAPAFYKWIYPMIKNLWGEEGNLTKTYWRVGDKVNVDELSKVDFLVDSVEDVDPENSHYIYNGKADFMGREKVAGKVSFTKDMDSNEIPKFTKYVPSFSLQNKVVYWNDEKTDYSLVEPINIKKAASRIMIYDKEQGKNIDYNEENIENIEDIQYFVFFIRKDANTGFIDGEIKQSDNKFNFYYIKPGSYTKEDRKYYVIRYFLNNAKLNEDETITK